ncbi:MAG: amino acid adenylation domain-containing protein [Pyrinomonadaceae bacterium]|nr:amino acid adenylation domain-containing protein [Pyrinomonadaceae bacterium]
MSTIVESHSLEVPSLSANVGEPLSECFGLEIDHFPTNTFPRLFEEQAARGPKRPAVVCGNDRLSYAELNSRANQLARYLGARGVGAETLVGICIERSLDMAVGILGILKSGAAYLPLDPDYPAERLTWMVSDSAVSLVVTTANLAAQLPASSQLVLLDSERAQISEEAETNLTDGPEPLDLAYVIYTSGSTGQPKGVMINHGSLANYVRALQLELGISESDRYLHTASIAFSSSRRQLLLPLSRGATVVIASSEQRKDPLALFELIKEEGITVMDAVPSFWRTCTSVLSSLDAESRAQLLDNRLRLMLSASEPLRFDIHHTWTHEFGHRAQHVHMFGQTETAGIVCVYKIPAICEETPPGPPATVSGSEKSYSAGTSVVPIGRPIANTEIYILDEEQRSVPVGTPGELYIGGAGVGRGYLNRPELTAQKFLGHPFSDNPGARLYRTGDWARMRRDGQIEFAGRQDSQVKVRGFRIELGEVEATLARHPAVKENVVVAREDGSGTMRLVAYVVPLEAAPGPTALRTFMADHLPDYMVPATFVQLAALPLNANGKVDRRSLPEPEESRPELATHYAAPRNAREELLAGICREVLCLERIGINDNFFELGGHSLLAIQVIARINEQLRTTVPLRLLFDGPTISELANAIEPTTAGIPALRQAKIERARRDQEIPLSFAQQRLWFIDQLEPGSSLYNINRALRLQGALDVTKLERAIQSIAKRHEVLRTTLVAQDGRPVQQIAPSVTLPFNFHDLQSMPETTREPEAQRIINTESKIPFDLARGPLARITLVRIGPADHILLLSIHHIIADAWALKIFFQELAAFYHEAASEASLPELQCHYADFASWQRRELFSDGFDQQLAYWKRQLAGAPMTRNIPSDYPRPAAGSSQGAQHFLSLSPVLSQSLRDMSRQEGVTLFMTLLAAFQILLAQYSRENDILVAVPVAGRTLVETEALIGCFVNTLILRGDLSGNPTFREVITRTRERALGAYSNQEVPFERLVEELQSDRNLSGNPLASVMFALQDESQPVLSLQGISVKAMPVEFTNTKFDLSLDVVEKAEGLDVWLSYSTELFDPASTNSMLEDFKLVLEWMVANPSRLVADLPPLRWTARVWPAEEHAEVLIKAASGAGPEFLAPRTPIEERLAGIWSEVLGVERLSVHDNFFGLGGHSLLAAQVISRTRNLFSVDLPLRRIFETPTVAGLAIAIYEMQAADTEDEELAAMLAELGQLSEEEAQRQFAEEF